MSSLLSPNHLRQKTLVLVYLFYSLSNSFDFSRIISPKKNMAKVCEPLVGAGI